MSNDLYDMGADLIRNAGTNEGLGDAVDKVNSAFGLMNTAADDMLGISHGVISSWNPTAESADRLANSPDMTMATRPDEGNEPAHKAFNTLDAMRAHTPFIDPSNFLNDAVPEVLGATGSNLYDRVWDGAEKRALMPSTDVLATDGPSVDVTGASEWETLARNATAKASVDVQSRSADALAAMVPEFEDSFGPIAREGNAQSHHAIMNAHEDGVNDDSELRTPPVRGDTSLWFQPYSSADAVTAAKTAEASVVNGETQSIQITSPWFHPTQGQMSDLDQAYDSMRDDNTEELLLRNHITNGETIEGKAFGQRSSAAEWMPGVLKHVQDAVQERSGMGADELTYHHDGLELEDANELPSGIAELNTLSGAPKNSVGVSAMYPELSSDADEPEMYQRGSTSKALGRGSQQIFKMRADPAGTDDLGLGGVEAGAGPAGWLVALTGAVVMELAASGYHDHAGMAGSQANSSEAAGNQNRRGPIGTRADPLHVRVLDQRATYQSHMPDGPTFSLPSQSLPVPGQVMFSP